MKQLLRFIVALFFGSFAHAQTVNGGGTSASVTSTVSKIANDVTTNATMFPVWVTANSGNLPLKVSSTLLTFNPSTGLLASPAFAGASFQTTSSAINAQTGTTYTVQASDNGKIVTLSNASAITVTVPASLGAGFSCTLIQIGAGQVSVTASGTTIRNVYSNTKLVGQWAQATLTAYIADNFIFSGDTSP